MAFNSLIARAVSEGLQYLNIEEELNVIELGNPSFRINDQTLIDLDSKHQIQGSGERLDHPPTSLV